MRLVDELTELHAHYAEGVNVAVAEDDLARAEHLAQAYDEEAVRLIAEHEGRLDLLPLVRPRRAEGTLARLVRRLRPARAA